MKTCYLCGKPKPDCLLNPPACFECRTREDLPLVAHFGGLDIAVDETLPPGTVLLKQGGREVARVVNVGQAESELAWLPDGSGHWYFGDVTKRWATPSAPARVELGSCVRCGHRFSSVADGDCPRCGYDGLGTEG